VVRRAIWRGVARTGVVAALSLTVLATLVVAVSAVVSSVRGRHFHLVAVNGMVVAHPEYEIQQEGSCCATGPLFGLTNLGLASEVALRVRPLGALNYPGTSIVTISAGLGGHIQADLDGGRTPLGDALGRGRPDSGSTVRFMDGLPESTVVSALVELRQPAQAEALQVFLDTSVPVTEVPNRGLPVLLVDPYEPRSTNPVSWRGPQLDELRAWAAELGQDDEENLRAIGLPSPAQLRRIVDEGQVHAFVVPRMPLALARALLADPAVRSVNILDVAFDLAAQAR
jgi:hypothetical protein